MIINGFTVHPNLGVKVTNKITLPTHLVNPLNLRTAAVFNDLDLYVGYGVGCTYTPDDNTAPKFVFSAGVWDIQRDLHIQGYNKAHAMLKTKKDYPMYFIEASLFESMLPRTYGLRVIDHFSNRCAIIFQSHPSNYYILMKGDDVRLFTNEEALEVGVTTEWLDDADNEYAMGAGELIIKGKDGWEVVAYLTLGDYATYLPTEYHLYFNQDIDYSDSQLKKIFPDCLIASSVSDLKKQSDATEQIIKDGKPTTVLYRSDIDGDKKGTIRFFILNNHYGVNQLETLISSMQENISIHRKEVSENADKRVRGS